MKRKRKHIDTPLPSPFPPSMGQTIAIPAPAKAKADWGDRALTAISVTVLCGFALLGLMFAGQLAGCNNPEHRSTYRIVSNGESFGLEERNWPFWSRYGGTGTTWPTLQKTEEYIDHLRQEAFAEAHPPESAKWDWIPVTENLKRRFEECPKALTNQWIIYYEPSPAVSFTTNTFIHEADFGTNYFQLR